MLQRSAFVQHLFRYVCRALKSIRFLSIQIVVDFLKRSMLHVCMYVHMCIFKYHLEALLVIAEYRSQSFDRELQSRSGKDLQRHE
jgi:hypothetical protein